MAWKYFKLAEFACKCGCKANLIDFDLIDLLSGFREELGFPLLISSGYRCPKHNAAVSSSGEKGPHTTGQAVDVLIMGAKAFKLIRVAMASEKVRGIGINQRGDHARRFIHIDTIDSPEIGRPTVWSY